MSTLHDAVLHGNFTWSINPFDLSGQDFYHINKIIIYNNFDNASQLYIICYINLNKSEFW